MTYRTARSAADGTGEDAADGAQVVRFDPSLG